VSTLRSHQFIGSEPADRATWLCLMCYCVDQETGGRIANASAWGDRKWQQLCGVTLREVNNSSELWRWENGDVVVAFYPSEKEAEVQMLRAIGKTTSLAKAQAARENGRLGGRPRNPTDIPTANPRETHAEPIEGKGREGKGSGREGASPPPPPSISKGIDTSNLLAEFGIPNSAKAVSEWRGGLNKIARCSCLDEARSFLRWAVGNCRLQGLVPEYFRQVRQLAIEWDAGQRNNHWSAA
jgi:hypothetical protein